MTHFSVLVCADDPDELDRLLAPYDENMETAPRRSYEEGRPQDHWAYRSLKADWEKALKTPEGQDRELESRARMYLKLSDPPTWAEVAWLHNGQYGDDDRMFLDTDFPEAPRAYTMTTYNPASKWDWWTIGGRWGGSLVYRAGQADVVLDADRGTAASWEMAGIMAGHCNGGPKRALDLEATRDEAGRRARERWDQWRALTSQTPEARPWKVFVAETENVPGYTIEQARQDYHAQPRVRALTGTDFEWFSRDAIELYSRPLEDILAEARSAAVPGYALVRRNGTWLAPGEMGWFGMSSDDESGRLAYQDAANGYIDSLPDDAWLIMVDAHI